MEDRWRSHSSQTTHRRAEYWDEMKKRKQGEKKEEEKKRKNREKRKLREIGGGSHARKFFDNSAISFPGSFTFFPHLSTPS